MSGLVMSSFDSTDEPRPPEKTTTERERLPVIAPQYTLKPSGARGLDHLTMTVQPVRAGVAAAAEDHEEERPPDDAQHAAEQRRLLHREHQKHPRPAS